MTTPYKLLAAALLALSLFGAGWWTGRGQKEVVIQDRIVVQEKQVVVHDKAEVQTVVQWKDRIVTVTRTVTKNGTVTETTKTEDKAKEKQQEKAVTHDSTEKQKSTDTAHTESSKPSLPNYSIGLGYRPVSYDSLRSYSYKFTELRAGVRVLGPVFGEVGVSGTKQVSIGVRIDL
jgi:hypothetical protein